MKPRRADLFSAPGQRTGTCLTVCRQPDITSNDTSLDGRRRVFTQAVEGMINILDICIIVVGLVIILRGYLRGFVKEVVSLGGLVLAVAVGVRFQPLAQKMLQDSFGPSNYNFIIGFVLLFVAALVVTTLIGALLSRLVAASPLSGLNRGLGLLTGTAKAAVTAVVAVFILVFLLGPQSSLLKGSRIAPWALEAAAAGIQRLPGSVGKTIEDADKAYRQGPGIRKQQ